MKKIFTLLVSALLGGVGCVNAQGTYAVKAGDAITPGLQITSVPNITMTWSDTEENFNAGKATDNWVISDFVAYSSGSTNGKFSEGSEPTGCLIKLEPVLAGTITVGIQINANKAFWVINKDFQKVTDYTYKFPKEADSEEIWNVTQNDKGEDVIGGKSNGTITFNVDAGGVYYVLATGTKAGFFGFIYNTTSSGINNIEAVEEAAPNAPVYNLAGQQVTKETKGILIQNGKKFINK